MINNVILLSAGVVLLVLFCYLRNFFYKTHTFFKANLKFTFNIRSPFLLSEILVEKQKSVPGCLKCETSHSKFKICIGTLSLSLVEGWPFTGFLPLLSVNADGLILVISSGNTEPPGDSSSPRRRLKDIFRVSSAEDWLARYALRSAIWVVLNFILHEVKVGECFVTFIDPCTNKEKLYYTHKYVRLLFSRPCKWVESLAPVGSPPSGASKISKYAHFELPRINLCIFETMIATKTMLITSEGYLLMILETKGAYHPSLRDLRLMATARAKRLKVSGFTSASKGNGSIEPQRLDIIPAFASICPLFKFRFASEDLDVDFCEEMMGLEDSNGNGPFDEMRNEREYYGRSKWIYAGARKFTLELSAEGPVRELVYKMKAPEVNMSLVPKDDPGARNNIYARDVSLHIYAKVDGNSASWLLPKHNFTHSAYTASVETEVSSLILSLGDCGLASTFSDVNKSQMGSQTRSQNRSTCDHIGFTNDPLWEVNISIVISSFSTIYEPFVDEDPPNVDICLKAYVQEMMLDTKLYLEFGEGNNETVACSKASVSFSRMGFHAWNDEAPIEEKCSSSFLDSDTLVLCGGYLSVPGISVCSCAGKPNVSIYTEGLGKCQIHISGIYLNINSLFRVDGFDSIPQAGSFPVVEHLVYMVQKLRRGENNISEDSEESQSINGLDYLFQCVDNFPNLDNTESLDESRDTAFFSAGEDLTSGCRTPVSRAPEGERSLLENIASMTTLSICSISVCFPPGSRDTYLTMRVFDVVMENTKEDNRDPLNALYISLKVRRIALVASNKIRGVKNSTKRCIDIALILGITFHLIYNPAECSSFVPLRLVADLDRANILFNLVSIYVLTSSFIVISGLKDCLLGVLSIPNTSDSSSSPQKEEVSKHNLQYPGVEFRVSNVLATLDLAGCETVEVHFKNLNICMGKKYLHLISSTTILDLPNVKFPCGTKLLNLDRTLVKVLFSQGGVPKISTSIWKLVFCVFHEYRMNQIILGVSIMRKCIEKMYNTYFSHFACNLGVNSENNPCEKWLPVFSVLVNSLEVILTSDEFSDRISRNYLLGLREQSKRLMREEEFEKRVLNLKSRHDTCLVDAEEIIARILDKFRTYNSEAWKKIISENEYKSKNKTPTLVSITGQAFNFTVRSLQVPESTIEAHMHKLDPLTSSSSIWDTLTAVSMELKLRGMIIKLRDYPHDLLRIPCYSADSLNCKGTVIFTDKYPMKDARFPHSVSLEALSLPPINVTRNINPLIIYYDLKTEINTDKPVIITWGASYDPCLVEVVDILDNFTASKEDSSPPIGWWDKMRLIFHGQNVITLSKSTDICFRLTGSFVPHFRSDVDWGAEGVELIVKGKTNLRLKDCRNAGILSEGLTIRLMNESYLDENDMESPMLWEDKVIMNLSGDVRMSFSAKFVTTSEDGDDTINERTHNDIHLVCAAFMDEALAKDHDSYRGFRTRKIRVVANLECKDTDQKGGEGIGNLLTIFDHSKIEKLSKIACVYQPPLINILTKSRHREKNSEGLSKPVFIHFLESVYATIDVRLLQVVLFSERANFKNIMIKGTTGRCVSEVLVMKNGAGSSPTLARELNPEFEVKSGPRIDLRNQSYQWFIPALKINFSDIVGWVSEVPAVANDLDCNEQYVESGPERSVQDMSLSAADLGKKERSERSTFNFMDFNEKRYRKSDGAVPKQIPFIWSENFVYSVKPICSSQLYNDFETGADFVFIYPNIFSTQVEICEKRLKDVLSALDRVETTSKDLGTHGDVGEINKAYQIHRLAEIKRILKKKEEVLEGYIRQIREQAQKLKTLSRQKRFMESNRELGDQPEKSNEEEAHGRTHRNELLVHNMKILWNREIRDLVYEIVLAKADRKGSEFCRSTFSVKSVCELAESLSHIFGLAKSNENLRWVSVMSKPKFPPRKSISYTESNWGPQRARILLQKLVSERETSYSVLENYSEMYKDRSESVNEDETADAAQFDDYGANTDGSGAFKGDADYEYGLAEKSKMYPYMKVEFINPQVCLSSYLENSDSKDNLACVSGNRILMYIDHIMQKDYMEHSRKLLSEEENKRVRTVLNVHMYRVQFFVGKFRRAMERYSKGVDYIVDAIGGGRGGSNFCDLKTPWIPMECVLDSNEPVGHLERVAGEHNAVYSRTWPNRLYTQISGTQDAMFHIERKSFHMPSLKMKLNSEQYFILYDLFTDVLIYEHPKTQENNSKLIDALILLEQTPDIPSVMKSITSLSEKIRSMELTLRQRTFARMFLDGQSANRNVLGQYKKLYICLKECQNELYTIVKALRKIQGSISNGSNISISEKLSVKIENGVWIMAQDDGEPLIECSLINLVTGHTMFHGSSLLNYLELDYMRIKYLKPFPFDDNYIIAPYVVGKEKVDFTRTKVVRIYWKENAPVSGIKVVSHFEINLFPISLKLTYGAGKSILCYFFPNKTTSTPASIHARSTAPLFRTRPTSSLAQTMLEDRYSSENNINMLTSTTPCGADKKFPSTDDLLKSFLKKGEEGGGMEGTSSFSAINLSKNTAGLFGIKIPMSSLKNIVHQQKSRRTLGRESNQPGRLGLIGKAEIKDLGKMQARAKEYRSFLYIKVPGAEHCFSYRRSVKKSFENFDNFVFRFPTLEFRNKTWSWTDLFDAVKKEFMHMLLVNTGVMVKEKIFARKRPEKKMDKAAGKSRSVDMDPPPQQK